MTTYIRHWHGYEEARQIVNRKSLPELLEQIDALFGRDNLRYGASEEDVRTEALRQTEIDWRVPAGYEGPLS